MHSIAESHRCVVLTVATVPFDCAWSGEVQVGSLTASHLAATFVA